MIKGSWSLGKILGWRVGWLFSWGIRHVFEICRAFLKELQEKGIFEKQLFWTMKVFSAQEDRADGHRLEKVSFDVIREISCSFPGYSWAVQKQWDGMADTAWLVSCMLWLQFRREPFREEPDTAEPENPWPRPSNMTVAKILHVRESRRCDWLIEYLSKVDKLEKTEAGLAWPVGDFYNNPDASLGGIFPRKCQRFQSWGKGIRNFRGPA